MKTILALETSAPYLSVALGNRKGRVRELVSKIPLSHSENLIPLIDRLLRKEGLAPADVDAFAIDRGPGSFTGLRIGFSLLKGFLAVRKRPCYGALSLDMMSRQISAAGEIRLGVVVDARREKVYARFYRSRRGTWVPERKLELLSPPELNSQMTRGTVLAGESLERYHFGHKIRPVVPTAHTLAEWFYEKDPRLLALSDPRDFLPLYLRASEAEEKRRAKKAPRGVGPPGVRPERAGGPPGGYAARNR